MNLTSEYEVFDFNDLSMALSKDYYIGGQNTQLIFFEKITTRGGLLLDHVFVVVAQG